MSSSIAEIRELVDDPDSDLASLLSRAALLASQLNQKAVTTWMRRELRGYREQDVLPDYRLGACGTLVAWFPGQGWVEAPIERAQTDEGLLCYSLYQSLPEVETAFNENSKSGGQRVDFTPERLAELQQQTRLSTRLALAVSSRSFALAVLAGRETVRLWLHHLAELGLPVDAHRFPPDLVAQAAAVDDRLPELILRATATARDAAAALKPKRRGFLSRLIGF